MKIHFTEYVNVEDLDLKRIVRDAGLAHEVDLEELLEKAIEYCREIPVDLVLDTETGAITKA